MKFKLENFNNGLFCFCLLSIFFPIKVYPIIFLLSSLSFFYERKMIIKQVWVMYLCLYSIYAVISFILSGSYDELRLTNFFKIFVNFIFLISSINWLYNKDTTALIRYIDSVLHFTFLLVFIQLMLYHKQSNFQFLAGAKSSGEGTDIYNPALFFWGLDNKNLFGARIVTIGFPYILIGAVRYNKISLLRIFIVIILAYMSMSRTPIFALMLGLLCIIWNVPGRYIKLTLLSLIAVITPFVLNSVLRIETVTSSNDGMGLRLIYWAAFFMNFDKISFLGEGFLSADKFLDKYALIYMGEPNIHNTFLNNYLDFGIFGFLFYTMFLISLFKYGKSIFNNKTYWITAFTPLLATMMVLFPGYDNDIIVYLILIFIIGQLKTFNYNKLSYSLSL